ncbi:MAG: hypothetical protein NTW26_00610, partial [bacterium]|nr:hypothetical protein [bacterium]
MRVSMLILLLPAVILAQVDVAFMLTTPRDRWSEAIEFVENDPRFDRVDYIYCRSFTPPLVAMQQYDVIFTGGSTYWDQDEFG